MMDEVAKGMLHRRLQRDREALFWKIDGLSEYDVRRPLTVTGTNLLGLVKHVATVEARYFGEVFGRPSPEGLPPWQDYDGSDLWVTEHETREQIRTYYRRTWAHSDTTIHTLELDTLGHVPWWPDPDPNTNLFAIMLHVLSETVRHAGHLDILREGLDGQTGLRAGNSQRRTRHSHPDGPRRLSSPVTSTRPCATADGQRPTRQKSETPYADDSVCLEMMGS